MSTESPTPETSQPTPGQPGNGYPAFHASRSPLRVSAGDPNARSADSRDDVVLAEFGSAPQLPALVPPLASQMVSEPTGTSSCADMVYDALGFHSSLRQGSPAVRVPAW